MTVSKGFQPQMSSVAGIQTPHVRSIGGHLIAIILFIGPSAMADAVGCDGTAGDLLELLVVELRGKGSAEDPLLLIRSVVLHYRLLSCPVEKGQPIRRSRGTLAAQADDGGSCCRR